MLLAVGVVVAVVLALVLALVPVVAPVLVLVLVLVLVVLLVLAQAVAAVVVLVVAKPRSLGLLLQKMYITYLSARMTCMPSWCLFAFPAQCSLNSGF